MNVRTYLHRTLALSAFLMLNHALLAQRSASYPGQDAAITAIRGKYQHIQAQRLTTQRFTYESSGCVEDGVVTYYFNGKQILKIVESGSIGDGSWVHEYYYDGDKVIFALESLEGGPAVGPVTKTQYRYYVKNGQVIRVMEGNKILSANDKAVEMLQTAAELLAAYKSRNFASVLCN